MANAKRSVKRINGSIAFVAAAAIGLDGSSEVSQLENVWACPPAVISPAASAAPAGSSCAPVCAGRNREIVSANGMTTMAVPARRMKKVSKVRPPMRPTDLMSPAELTATISNETINGITVIRIAFTHRVPRGATKSAA